MATFTQAVKTCLTEKFCTAKGRASRSEYWWFFLFSVVIQIVGIFFFAFFFAAIGALEFYKPVFVLFIIVFSIPTFAVAARRLHDLNCSGWWAGALYIYSFVSSSVPRIYDNLAIIFVPISLIVTVAWIVAMAKKGTPSPNRFGEPPIS